MLIFEKENVFKKLFQNLNTHILSFHIFTSRILFTKIYVHTYAKLYKYERSFHHCQGTSTNKMKEKKEIKQRETKELGETKNLAARGWLHTFNCFKQIHYYFTITKSKKQNENVCVEMDKPPRCTIFHRF